MENCNSCHKRPVQTRFGQCQPCQAKTVVQVAPGPQMGYAPKCDCNFRVHEVSNHAGTYIFDIDGCRQKLDIKKGVKANETVTHMTTTSNGDIVYTNEKGRDESVNIKELLPYARLEDLGNVGNDSGDDSTEFPEGCIFMFKQKGDNFWSSWSTKTHGLKAGEKAVGIMVFTENGCPRYLPAPKTGAATLTAKGGKVDWTPAPLPEGANVNEFNPAWGNINETLATDNSGNPTRTTGIFTHNPAEDACGDITYR